MNEQDKSIDDSDNLVRVSIFGHEYTVKAPADSTYIKNIAEYVDNKMHEVQDGLSSSQSSTRIAILAAMNVTDELFTSNRDKDNLSSEVESKVLSLIDKIDQELA
ncbi:MAG: cell division protein ZapA [Candidatus Marinimicrobia bacterium]|jgi:cell division protein ZapA|nr:cell division protein ZapA [Candidatus Neomarinimicrobiota bacterium]MBT3618177.1 cell division protein ZapA [Candidatus Neomarinimicrobiota bacterium]MBT3828648.1 cell division protein ZapA [Candidatus Neomarinimicrobiota bacterium]MBT3996890.1 cell division protein ZapA [Candidatus Neomarinimicrobiota bacterium]MBT4280854.1 cell division protein ZapA [Candidatus Neomarinimicrobiota bacterium]